MSDEDVGALHAAIDNGVVPPMIVPKTIERFAARQTDSRSAECRPRRDVAAGRLRQFRSSHLPLRSPWRTATTPARAAGRLERYRTRQMDGPPGARTGPRHCDRTMAVRPSMRSGLRLRSGRWAGLARILAKVSRANQRSSHRRRARSCPQLPSPFGPGACSSRGSREGEREQSSP